MAPHSPGTDQIETLLWIGFVAATILIVAVNAALIYALRRYRASRGAEPREESDSRRLQLRAGGALAAFALALFVVSLVYTENAREAPASGAAGLQAEEPLRIEGTGQQWLWRYEYPNEAFSYYKLVVPVDTAVELDLVSTDVVHTWDVPALAGKGDAVPGKTKRVVFSADEEGTYHGQSATLSGAGLRGDADRSRSRLAEEYEAFVEQRKSEIQAAQDRVVDLIEAGETP